MCARPDDLSTSSIPRATTFRFTRRSNLSREWRLKMTIAYGVASGDARLDCLVWTPESGGRREGVVFCHGWGGGAQYDDLLERLAHNGYFAMRFQQRGYGNSTGQSDLSLWVEDMAGCASALGAITNKIWAAGQSTGGTMSLIAAA